MGMLAKPGKLGPAPGQQRSIEEPRILRLIASAAGWLLPARLGASAVLPPDYDPGVDPAIHAAPPSETSPGSAADGCKSLRNNAF